MKPSAAPQSQIVAFLDLRAATTELEGEINDAISRVVRSGWYILGEEVAAFEAEFASYVEASYAVGVGNGLDAISLALKAVGVRAGDEVIVPANTFIATWLAVRRIGAVPVGVEPIEGVWNLDPSRIEASITPRTRAIVPVHLYGQPADLDAISSIAARHKLLVVEDAAQAHGASYAGRRVGGRSHATAWSFYPGKNLGALGDGGAVTTSNSEVAARVRALGNYGSTKKYHHDLLGENSRLDELQAAVLRVKLRRLDDWNARRRRVAAAYEAGLRDVPGLRLPHLPAGSTQHVWHLFVVDHDDRDALQAHLASLGIQTLVHYPIPPHRSGAFLEYGLSEGSFPITERSSMTHLSLPIGPHLTEASVSRIVDACRSFRTSGPHVYR